MTKLDHEEIKQDPEFAAAVKAEVTAAVNPSPFDAMEEDDILDLNESSIFYDDFPSLPDFPCMSSSSSSPSTPATAATSSSSAATINNFHRSENGDDIAKSHGPVPESGPGRALSSTASMEIPPPSDQVDCVSLMEDFGYIDLIDCNEMWDPSSVFQSENPQDDDQFMDDQQAAAAQALPPPPDENDSFGNFLQQDSELAVIFFEWLKQNRDYISAEDMRSIKLKRSTIESASKRLGATREGKKQLLKLILEWVEQYQLHKKPTHDFNPNPNPSPNPGYAYPITPDLNASYPWMPPQPVFGGGDVYMNTVPIMPAPMNHRQVVNGIPYPSEYPIMEHARSWPLMSMGHPQFNAFVDNNSNVMSTHHHQGLYGNPYPMFDPNGGERLGPSATKEARKKRMARHRRMYSHHNRHNNSHSSQNQNQTNDVNEGGGDGGEDGDGNWMCWLGGNEPPGDLGDRAAKGSLDRRLQQGWKSEKNLKFLLQKVLKQSDVGNLGRIVLPKKEAETHLPELETRDGISIAMEDIGTSRVWNMRYRFWPNNKSRMYLLENTGDFVRVNGLQEGDFIVIYSDTKCGKYMIRGVKVRNSGTKLEGKKPAKRNVRSLSLGNSSLAPMKQTVR